MVIGWDIGGAHIKAAYVHNDGSIIQLAQRACPLWKGVKPLQQTLLDMVGAHNIYSTKHKITMTGELADGFLNRQTGIEQIVDTVTHCLEGDVQVYAGCLGFIECADAVKHYEDIASANWYATSGYIAKHIADGVMVDVGSTTTDIVPFKNNKPVPHGLGDNTRLRCGELIYSGIVRTPIMAISNCFEVDGQTYPIMAELFATTADVYRLLGTLPEHADMYPACDNGDKDCVGSARRLARMFGCDYANDLDHWQYIAQAIADIQQAKIMKTIAKMVNDFSISGKVPLVGAGVGHFIVRDIAKHLGQPFVKFDTLVGTLPKSNSTQAISCASALSLALLAVDKKHSQ